MFNVTHLVRNSSGMLVHAKKNKTKKKQNKQTTRQDSQIDTHMTL